MAGKVFAAVCFILGAFLMACLSADAAPAGRGRRRLIVFSFVAVVTNETFVTSPDFPKFGTSIYFDTPVFNTDLTLEIGEEAGRCDAMRMFGQIYCTLGFNFFGRGEIEVAGRGSFAADEVLAVVGGTGEFSGVRGYVQGTPANSNDLSFNYTAYLRF